MAAPTVIIATFLERIRHKMSLAYQKYHDAFRQLCVSLRHFATKYNMILAVPLWASLLLEKVDFGTGKAGRHFSIFSGLILDPPGYACFYSEKSKFIDTGYSFPHCMAFLEKGEGLVLVYVFLFPVLDCKALPKKVLDPPTYDTSPPLLATLCHFP